jgi:hypothetical protein
MIQLNDLSKGLTEVLDSELGLVVGGDSSLGSPLQSSSTLGNEINFNYNGNLSQPLDIKGANVSYTSPGGYGFAADGLGNFSAKTPLGNTSTGSAAYNPFSGNYNVGFSWKF